MTELAKEVRRKVRGRPQTTPNERVVTAVRIEKKLLKAAKHLAIENDCSLNDVITAALNQYVVWKP